jgi:pantoate--beta-alanine ligase
MIQIDCASGLTHFSAMRIVTSAAAMQRLAKQWQRHATRIGFVPTMGYLHEGHLSLVREARRRVGKSGKVVVSIYVNPTQFGPKEDLSRYPRDLQGDLIQCRSAGVDVVFAPGDEEMYPDGSGTGVPPVRSQKKLTGETPVPLTFSTYVVEERLSRSMEGAARPGHFRGVTTVVAKLFNIVLPDVAVFGAKDFQQAAIVKRMVADVNFPVRVVVAPTVRERDGLAMSSRNKYLDPVQRAQATILHRAIQRARAAVKRQPQSAARLKTDLKKFIATAPLARLDYVEFFDPETLSPVAKVLRGAHLALAIFLGKTRLIDNGRL